MTILFDYLNNHGVFQYVYSDPVDIQLWLDTIPNADDFEFLIYAIPLLEQSNIFGVRDVAAWYGLLCNKISNNLDIEVYALGLTTDSRRNEIKKRLGIFIKLLIALNVLNLDMQGLISSFLNRSQEALGILLLLFVADGIITEATLMKLQVELSPYKRWQTIGLPSLPTIAEIENMSL